MNIWENAVVTEKGLALLAKLAEGNTLDITDAETGMGYVTPGLLVKQTAVLEPKQAPTFRNVTYPEEGTCSVACYLNNDDLDNGYTANQVGIYATDPDEGRILFFIAQASNGTGTIIPSNEEMPGYTAEWTFYFKFGQADGVTVYVDPASMITQEAMERYIASEILVATNDEIDAAYNAAE